MRFEAKISDTEGLKIHAEKCDVDDMAAAVAAIISHVYYQLRAANKGAAERFREGITACVTLPDSPMWDSGEKNGGIGVVVLGNEPKKRIAAGAGTPTTNH